jgi:hypothetical protein
MSIFSKSDLTNRNFLEDLSVLDKCDEVKALFNEVRHSIFVTVSDDIAF